MEINYTCTGDSFEGTDFVCWPSRDRVSIFPRLCVDFAKIKCRFHSERISRDRVRRDRVSISPGDILEFVGVQLRFEKSSPRWKIVGREKIDEI